MRWASKTFSIEQSDLCIPLKKSILSTGCAGSDCSIEKIGIEKALFRLRKNARFGLRSEIALFDTPIRLQKSWPNIQIVTIVGDIVVPIFHYRFFSAMSAMFSINVPKYNESLY